MKVQPIVYLWRVVEVVDEQGIVTRVRAMVPVPKYANVAKRQFGEEDGLHTLEQIGERSMASHNQFFAAINDHYDNLPERMAARWPSSEHFRKWLLVETGWCDEKEFDMESEVHAKRLGTFIRTEDDFARIRVVGRKVIVRKPKSQALAAMGKTDFEASKRAVLDLAEHLTGISRGEAMKHAGRSA